MSLYLVLCPACTRLPVTNILVFSVLKVNDQHTTDHANERNHFSDIGSAMLLFLLCLPKDRPPSGLYVYIGKCV